MPLVYLRDGRRHQTQVRLRGVHHEAELLAMVQGRAFAPPKDRPKKKEDPKPPDGKPKDNPDSPKESALPLSSAGPCGHAMPDAVKPFFEARSRASPITTSIATSDDRVWRAAIGHGDFAAAGGTWMFRGTLTGGGAPPKSCSPTPRRFAISRSVKPISTYRARPRDVARSAGQRWAAGGAVPVATAVDVGAESVRPG